MERTHRRWSGRLGVLVLLAALGVMFALISVQVFTTPLSRNDLGLLGGLRVTVDDDTRVYVGDRFAGQGTVDITWNEMLGATGREPLAIPLPPETPLADSQGFDAVVAEKLGSTTAEVVWSGTNVAGVHRGSHDINFVFRPVLLRRNGGQFDHVFVIHCQIPEVEGPWHRMLIAVRTRKDGSDAPSYFPQLVNAGGGNVNRGMIPSRRDRATFELKLSAVNGAPPEELADELADVDLWQPTSPPSD